MAAERKPTKRVYADGVAIGGGAPITVQSMTNVDPHDEKGLREQIARLSDAGCDIVRLTVPDMEAAEVFGRLRRTVKLPMVADIHFDYRLALAALQAGASKIRINPGNIGDVDHVRQVVEAARIRQVPIRVGVNAGSLEKDLRVRMEADPGDRRQALAQALADSALRNVRLIEDLGYDALVVSVKASDVQVGDMAYRLVAAATDHPLHIGVTEAGTPGMGQVKSAAGIGSLLLSGLGDTLRVSLTADPVEEVYFGKKILRALGLLPSAIDLISCPTCGRTKIDLESLATRVERELMKLEAETAAEAATAAAGTVAAEATLAPQTGGGPAGSVRPLTVAVMGCPVNGPGEARHADVGVAGGDGKGVLFAKGQVVGTVEEDRIVEALMELVRKVWRERNGKTCEN